ncbi:hypothetical protein C1924_12675 [Stenotrophomonas sp. ESTM1D_MKCIP4_1]|uniref:hypothetical protein n=1 Tax=Stenotrophomonas sp. ESTM1D_MKCIP4_1 TaxID=2072414 RepID=UPI000D53F536|nr:hypothetical protein [Stenotrophomonas sp. ESTM1D_MKCIP4_1]AWH53974.1 hypothetical protein C1924_12675 [Stenotrophomonas sp. ESTM1D_MKCIP4_1]
MPLPRAEQLIDLLLARQQHPLILEKRTRLPYGWAIWLRSLKPIARPFHAGDVIAVLLPRPLPGRTGLLPALSPWGAARRLLWQGWEPAPRDQRWMRWTSALLSALLHLLFFLALLWVAVIRTSAPEEPGAEGERVQIEFVGRGAQEGGGDQPGAEAAAAAEAGAAASGQAAGEASAPQPQPAASAAAAPAVAASAAVAPPPPVQSEPAPPAAPPPTPVQATEVAEATTDFVVPPVSVPRTEVTIVPRDTTPAVRERSVQTVQAPSVTMQVRQVPMAVPAPAVREVQVQEREVATLQTPVAPQPVRSAEVQVRLPQQREVQVRERDVQPVVDPQVRMAAVPGREPSVRAPTGRDVQVRERTVANAQVAAPSPSSGAGSTPAPAASAPSETSASASRAPAGSTRPAQAGARPAPDPGNWATPAKGDDWGASQRNRDGARSGAAQASTQGAGQGLFNADGSVNVPGQEGKGAAERGAPGGANDGWTKERIAESGRWLKRPPYDYTPTSFDKYWVPQESLLAEWVRKGVKAMEIPLPGTSTKISCVISILQAGGGCGLTDPNMQDQPAVARPPPDIPFKKELQEDNGSR